MAKKITTKSVHEQYKSYLKDWKDCTRCPLHCTRTQTVHFRGVLPCEVLFIGEAPGEVEDALGQPFIGPAGKILDALINELEGRLLISPTKIPKWGICNVLACLPAKLEPNELTGIDQVVGFREPSKEEVAQCLPRLERLIKLSGATKLILLGKVAAKWTYTAIVHQTGINVLEVWHPSYILRKGGIHSGEFTKTLLQIERFLTQN